MILDTHRMILYVYRRDRLLQEIDYDKNRIIFNMLPKTTMNYVLEGTAFGWSTRKGIHGRINGRDFCQIHPKKNRNDELKR